MRICLFTTTFTLVVLLTACSAAPPAANPSAQSDAAAQPLNPPAGEWIVGIIAPESGVLATVGATQVRTALLWQEQVNARGGIRGRSIRLLRCNDEGNPERSATCARDLLSQGAVLLINYSVTGPIRATMPLVKNGPIMITPSPNIVPNVQTDPYVFQTSPSDKDITQALADYAVANRIRSIGMIAATDASGEVGVQNAQMVFPAAGLDLKLRRIDLNETDATPQLAALVNDGVDLIYSSYTGGGAATVVKSYASLRLRVPLVVSYGNVTDSFIALIKDTLPPRLMATGLKAIVPDLLSDESEKMRTLDFMNTYHTKYNQRADMLNLTALNVVDVAHAILENVPDPKDAAAAKHYLESNPIRSSQTMRFSDTNHVGLSASDVTLLELKNEVWVKADPIR